MKRSELFALAMGIIGLVADSITISLFFMQSISSNSTGSNDLSAISKFIIVGLMIYGWFIVSWMLARRAWRRSPNSGSFHKKSSSAVTAIGVLLIPLQIVFLSALMPFSDPMFHDDPIPMDNIQWVMFIFLVSIVTLCILGAIVYFAIAFLMPVIYDDMDHLV